MMRELVKSKASINSLEKRLDVLLSMFKSQALSMVEMS